MLGNLKAWSSNKLVIAIFSILTLIVFLVSLLFIRNYHKLGNNPKVLYYFTISTISLLVSVIILIIFKIYFINIKTVKNSLKRKVVITFSIAVAVPTFIIAIFSGIFINSGVEAWFHDRVVSAITASESVAEAYLNEHKENIRTDILFIANDIDKQFYLFSGNRELLSEYLNLQAKIRALAEIVIFQSGKLVASSNFATTLDFSKLPKDVLLKADQGDLAIIDDNKDSVRAVIKLQNFLDSYVVAARYVDNKVLNHIASVNGAANEYKKLMENLWAMQIKFSIIFLVLSAALILIVIYYGILFAEGLTNPLSNLVKVTEKVKEGNLKIRSKESQRNDEIGMLGLAFNKMIEKIEKQHFELILTNDRLDEESRFIEKVLLGVSAGIIAVDNNFVIKLINPAAEKILPINTIEAQDKVIFEYIPEFKEFFQDKNLHDNLYNKQIEIIREGKKIIVLLNILADRIEDKIQGFIITFDDITNLVAAQRSAAWSDIARRIAHEMKNPLTPIRLAAERIKKKYFSYLPTKEDQEGFDKYTTMIMSNVDIITGMVNEFVNFARLPAPEFKEVDLEKLAKNAIFAINQFNESVKFEVIIPQIEKIAVDEKQIERVLLNLFKNSVESLNLVDKENKWVKLSIWQDALQTYFEIEDNGKGFDDNVIEKLTEPYITTKSNGSGLGLAIVKKIVEDHNGTISFINKGSDIGAVVKFTVSNNLTFKKI